jgi:hypothetical protein
MDFKETVLGCWLDSRGSGEGSVGRAIVNMVWTFGFTADFFTISFSRKTVLVDVLCFLKSYTSSQHFHVAYSLLLPVPKIPVLLALRCDMMTLLQAIHKCFSKKQAVSCLLYKLWHCIHKTAMRNYV